MSTAPDFGVRCDAILAITTILQEDYDDRCKSEGCHFGRMGGYEKGLDCENCKGTGRAPKGFEAPPHCRRCDIPLVVNMQAYSAPRDEHGRGNEKAAAHNRFWCCPCATIRDRLTIPGTFRVKWEVEGFDEKKQANRMKLLKANLDKIHAEVIGTDEEGFTSYRIPEREKRAARKAKVATAKAEGQSASSFLHSCPNGKGCVPCYHEQHKNPCCKAHCEKCKEGC